MPDWGAERIHSMIETRPDWCVSRQRVWGVPLVVLYCEKCKQRLEDFTALRSVIRWFEREGADAWFRHPAEELLPPGTKCNCGAAQWRKEMDILDVWFDSGSSSLAVLDPPRTSRPDGVPWPADVYLEGPDQYRGWFQSSLVIAMGVRGASPYRQVVTHGWTLDDKNDPMSKSIGNAVLPSDVWEKWGADLIRVWVTSQDYTGDVRFSSSLMPQLGEAYRKLRNTFRFALGNLADFDPARDALPLAEMEEMDRWMLERTANLVRDCRQWYEGFEFHRVFHALHDFAVVELSAFYFDILKDRLYTFAPRNHARRSAQTAIYSIASALLRLAAPILVYTAEEIWKFFPRPAGEPESVHMARFPDAAALGTGLHSVKTERWELLRSVRNEVLKALEAARNAKTISGGLEARVILSAQGDLAGLLEEYAEWLPALFIVSQVELSFTSAGAVFRSEAVPGLEVSVRRADGAKCERCWNYSTRVGENADYPTICERCTAALAEIEAASS
jgi:isoleucyl-tRNA synthetase